MNNKKIKKYFFLILFWLYYFISYNILTVEAASPLSPGTWFKESDQTSKFQGQAGFESNITISSIVATIIQAFLGLLGIIFIVLIVMAGYKWMNAAGNEEKVTEAKDTIRRAVIGLIITVSAYAITYFVFTNLPGGGTTVPG